MAISLVNIFTIYIFLLGSTIAAQEQRRHCGGLDHSTLTRPCRNNDTDCGQWNDKWWNPYNCHYRDVTPDHARKCIGNRTLACIGDSQIRDTCLALVYLLLGIFNEKDTMLMGKFDRRSSDMDNYGTIIDDVPFWKLNVPPHNHNGYIFPKPFNSSFTEHKWQLQMWSLFRREFMYGGQAVDIIKNRMVNATQNLRPIDFVLWNYGLHDYGWFQEPPRGQRYYDALVKSDFVNNIPNAKMPMVWVSMNQNCKAKMREEELKRDQAGMVTDANAYVNMKFLQSKLPYWDADAVLRTDSSCERSADGVHVNMYVDMMRAKMLLNHLCDHNWNWRDNPLKHFL